MPEGVEMCHVTLYKKETEKQVKLLQNRLDLLKRQEQFIQRATTVNNRNSERVMMIKREA